MSDFPQKQRNWGTIGFIISLWSFATCGILSPVALILSLMGIRTYPHGFAIAGIAISLLQLIVVIVFGITPVWAIACTGIAGTAAMIAGKKIFE